MKRKGDKILDTVLRNFRSVARPAVQRGHGVNLEDCLERAIVESRYELKNAGYNEKSVRNHIWEEEENVRCMCSRIIVEIEKRDRLLDIRKTSVEAILNDFSKSLGLSVSYKLRDNSTVGFSVQIPATGQYMKFNVAYSKVLSDEWRAGLSKDIQDFLAISGRLGRLRVSPRGNL